MVELVIMVRIVVVVAVVVVVTAAATVAAVVAVATGVAATMVQYISRNMYTVFALLCFVVVIHWLIFPYPSGLLHWHCGNLTIAPVPAKQPWWIWINTSCEFITNDCITTTKQSTTKPCAYFLGYTVVVATVVELFKIRRISRSCWNNPFLKIRVFVTAVRRLFLP